MLFLMKARPSMETLTKKATIADYQQLPEGARYQLIDGEIIDVPSPTARHQKIAMRISAKLFFHAEKNSLGTVLFAPMDVYLNDENAVQPDILFVSKANEAIIRENGIYGAPDLIVEILSPSTSYYDTKRKFRLYEKHGVQEYWLIDPADDEAVGYELQSGRFHEFQREIARFNSRVLGLEVVFS